MGVGAKKEAQPVGLCLWWSIWDYDNGRPRLDAKLQAGAVCGGGEVMSRHDADPR